MLPFDRRPWARSFAIGVIAVTVLGVITYAWTILSERPLDWGERVILMLVLLTVIPPNVVIIRRKSVPPKSLETAR